MTGLHKDDEILEQFKALYKKNAPILTFYAAKFVDTATAEDLVQDVFLKIWNKRSFVFLKEGIHTYLYNAVRHSCLDHLKHLDIKADYAESLRTRLKIEELYYTDDPTFLYQEDNRLQSIYKEIDKLPGKCREIFVMAYLEERKTTEIATLLNISKRTVESQLYKALKHLRETISLLFF
jgi:RNA polymerase sigma-70 factor (ECF subfamily)